MRFDKNAILNNIYFKGSTVSRSMTTQSTPIRFLEEKQKKRLTFFYLPEITHFQNDRDLIPR